MDAPVKVKRSIAKVIILGHNRSLLAGYLRLSAANCVSFQMYSTLGVGIGVARAMHAVDREIALQIWTIPLIERLGAVSLTFAKGYRAAVALLKPEDVDGFDDILRPIRPDSMDSLMIVIVGSIRDAETSAKTLEEKIGKPLAVRSITSVAEALDILVDEVANDRFHSSLPMVLSLPEAACPEFHPNPAAPNVEPLTSEEVQFIRGFAEDIGLEIVSNYAHVMLREGIAKVHVESGVVEFSPKLCGVCKKSCHRSTRICIVGLDNGWSNEGLSKTALLILAKLQGLFGRRLPDHVEIQIRNASNCSNFNLDWSRVEPNDNVLRYLISEADGPQRDSLLEAAKKRLSEGRLSINAFNILKSWLERISS